MGENDKHILPCSTLELEGRKVTGYPYFFTLVEDVGRYCYGIVIVAEVRGSDVIDSEQILH